MSDQKNEAAGAGSAELRVSAQLKVAHRAITEAVRVFDHRGFTRGWADCLPEDATAAMKEEAQVMHPQISQALRDANLKPIRLGSGAWKIIRERTDHQRAEDETEAGR